MELDNRYATSGKGNAAMALGIIGTVLGALSGGFGGCGNNLWGNRSCGACESNCSENTPVTRYELQQEQKISSQQAEISLLKANTYNDQKSLELYKYFDGELKDIRKTLGEQAVVNQKTADSFALVQQDIAMEAERRCCGDNSIVNYANATFYPKMVADVTTGTTNTAQTLYNPLPKCGSCCNGNN